MQLANMSRWYAYDILEHYIVYGSQQTTYYDAFTTFQDVVLEMWGEVSDAEAAKKPYDQYPWEHDSRVYFLWEVWTTV